MFASAVWAMSLTLAIMSLFNDLTPGGAGQTLARLFAATLALSGFFLMGLAIALMRDERHDSVHYVIPSIAGVLAGLLETALILNTAGYWLLLPFLLVAFVVPPVRNVIEPRRRSRR
jgi:hypothetical protein